MENRIIKIIQGLLGSADCQKMLDELKLSPATAMRMLKSKQGQRQLKAQKQLSKLQSVLLADRFGPFAVQRLTELLHEKEPDLRLKSALSILEVSGVRARRAAPKPQAKPKSRPTGTHSAKAREMVRTVGDLLRKHRSAMALAQEQASAEKDRLPS